ncbi:MAG: pantoate--beta-alanine ligase [Syntrophobacteraceae bacterium]|nr:pantoate--beta-alanine ligase [Syntrophobacteraceae bacterium]
MRIIENVGEMQRQADAWRAEGEKISFVPTMGFLHEGHLSLLRSARTLGSKSVVSIFVNPTQFGPTEDFASYPRDVGKDLELSGKTGTDAAFVPAAAEMYPDGFQTFVEVTRVTKNLCGASRPIFFRGVATVVSKLFHAVKPHVAVFGQKDFQQLVAIRRMVKDLNMDVEIVGHPIVREKDGLAMSSRNTYLLGEERLVALRLHRSLEVARELVGSGEKNGGAILQAVNDCLTAGGGAAVDYARLCDTDTIEEVEVVEGPTLLALAVWVGKTRLIDNCVLGG